MGQCTSGELPPAIQIDNKNGNVPTNELPSDASGSPDPSLSSKKSRRSSRSVAASWVANKLSKRSKNSQVSAAFNLLDHEVKGTFVNINTATEEELMTLDGVSRQLAKNIVEYRNTIGGFKRIEDLVLVSGVGASVLQSIKNDITIKKYPSHSSSRTQSFDSIPSCESLRSQRSSQSISGGRSIKSSPIKVINVNKATIFDLMNVRGMSQELAANIVHYRTKKGNFKSIDEMVKVKGINSRVLSLLRVYLTCDDAVPSSPVNSDSMSLSSCGKPPLPPPRFVGHRRTHSAPLQANDDLVLVQPLEIEQINSHRFSSEFSADLFELLSLRSGRPISYNIFNGSYQGFPAIRMGSWNLQQLNKDKINNPGVLEVICRSILETGFSLISLQEITSKDVLEKICSELNCGSLRRVKEWNGPKGDWRWQIGEDPIWKDHARSEYAAFIYNNCHGVQLISSNLLHSNNNYSKNSGIIIKKPFLGYFKVRGLDLVVVNLHIKLRHKRNNKIREEVNDSNDVLTNGNTDVITENIDVPLTVRQQESIKKTFEMSSIEPLIGSLKERLNSEKHVVLLGSFGLPPDDEAFDILRANSHSPVISPETTTNISYDSPEGDSCLDNIWLSSHCLKLYTGSSGVVREGLSHMAIPRGWGWGGMVSDHCPIYCDVYTEVVNAVNCDKSSASDAVSTTVNIADSNCNQDS